jgi:mannose-6-phosphate isomerase
MVGLIKTVFLFSEKEIKNKQNSRQSGKFIMRRLYPLKFRPLFKDKIWGGQKIRTSLGLDFSPLPNCGEVWVLSGVPGSETKVSNGYFKGNSINELLEVFMDDLVGEKSFEKSDTEFPILIKFIDSNEYLSVQVHPNDELAAKRKIGNGKTEMWYILEADHDAELISGFNRKMDKKTYLDFLNKKQLKKILNFEPVAKGDVFYIPSGRIHALGPGILLTEIQQTSDTTYRIYDWDRLDDQGKSRELHTELALDAIDFSQPDSSRTKYKQVQNKPVNLVNSPCFTTNILSLNEEVHRDYEDIDSFVILVGVSGSVIVDDGFARETLKTGETILIPAILKNLIIKPEQESKILEVYIV